jgi:hypothetical protein
MKNSLPRFEYRLLLEYTDFFKEVTIANLWLWQIKTNRFPKKWYAFLSPGLKDDKIEPPLKIGTYPLNYNHSLSDNKCLYEIINLPDKTDIFLRGGKTIDDIKNGIIIGEKLILPDFKEHYQLEGGDITPKILELYLQKLDSEIIIYK